MPDFAEETHGDDNELPCPYCGVMNYLADGLADHGGRLNSWECHECVRTFDVEVEYSVSITATAREQKVEQITGEL